MQLGQTIAERAAGNPFFAEEIVRDLAERGVLLGERGATCRPRTMSTKLLCPPRCRRCIAARIDRLPAAAKSILNAAAVIGSHFDVDTLQALRPETESTRLDRTGVG